MEHVQYMQDNAASQIKHVASLICSMCQSYDVFLAFVNVIYYSK